MHSIPATVPRYRPSARAASDCTFLFIPPPPEPLVGVLRDVIDRFAVRTVDHLPRLLRWDSLDCHTPHFPLGRREVVAVDLPVRRIDPMDRNPAIRRRPFPVLLLHTEVDHHAVVEGHADEVPVKTRITDRHRYFKYVLQRRPRRRPVDLIIVFAALHAAILGVGSDTLSADAAPVHNAAWAWAAVRSRSWPWARLPRLSGGRALSGTALRRVPDPTGHSCDRDPGPCAPGRRDGSASRAVTCGFGGLRAVWGARPSSASLAHSQLCPAARRSRSGRRGSRCPRRRRERAVPVR